MGPNFWKGRSPFLLGEVLVNTYKRAQKACSVMVASYSVKGRVAVEGLKDLFSFEIYGFFKVQG